MRTGRASLALLDGVRVNYYGAPTPLAQVASLSVPDSRTIAIQPWDSKMTGEIEKAIQKSDLGLTPMNDGKVVRINIPPLTEERRKELVKVIKRMEEECKVALRNLRRDGNEQLKTAKKDKLLSEDDQFKLQDEVQKLIDSSIEKGAGDRQRQRKGDYGNLTLPSAYQTRLWSTLPSGWIIL